MGTIQKTATCCVALAWLALLARAGSSAGQEAQAAAEPAGAAGKVPEDFEVVDGTPGARSFAKKARDPRTGVVFILVEPGTFQMGAPDASAAGGDERPRHEVRITKPFCLGETEVTVGQWRAFARKGGYRTEAEQEAGGVTLAAGWSWTARADALWTKPMPLHEYEFDDLHSVTQVSWNDADSFCLEYGYRLPSEAEWEYACRAGTSAEWWWGCEAAQGEGNFGDRALDTALPDWPHDVFPFDDERAFTAPAGAYAPNPWGFRDMLGNVSEWCADAYDQNFYAGAPAADPLNSAPGPGTRVIRGGSWRTAPWACRSASRNFVDAEGRTDTIGFRVARGL